MRSRNQTGKTCTKTVKQMTTTVVETNMSFAGTESLSRVIAIIYNTYESTIIKVSGKIFEFYAIVSVKLN